MINEKRRSRKFVVQTNRWWTHTFWYVWSQQMKKKNTHHHWCDFEYDQIENDDYSKKKMKRLLEMEWQRQREREKEQENKFFNYMVCAPHKSTRTQRIPISKMEIWSLLQYFFIFFFKMLNTWIVSACPRHKHSSFFLFDLLLRIFFFFALAYDQFSIGSST